MEKPILDWLEIIRTHGKSGWSQFYKSMLGHPISDVARFYSSVDHFGDTVVFEAIVATSTKNIKDDPLNYVLSVAGKFFIEKIETIDEDKKYQFALDKAKERVRMQNEELEIKIEQAKEISRGYNEII